nr:hypothetical protein [Pectinatus cerevisiiphilus]
MKYPTYPQNCLHLYTCAQGYQILRQFVQNIIGINFIDHFHTVAKTGGNAFDWNACFNSKCSMSMSQAMEVKKYASGF